jgi:cell division septation protein DedD
VTAVPSNAGPAAQIRKLMGKGRFTVQIAAVSDRAAAAERTAMLKRNGFESVTVMASVKGRILYRIRVGSFPSKSVAARAAEKFHTGFGLSAIPVEN